MDYKKTFSNDSGATLIYILAAFMIISFIGVTMIKQSHHDVTASSDFSSMSTAGHAATSGVEATRQYLENAPDSTLKLLNTFFKNRAPLWILGSATTTIPVDNSLRFKTQLINFSFDSTTYTNNFRITIQSYGFGRGNSRNTITSVLNVNGISWDQTTVLDPSNTPKNALQLDNGNFEFNTKTIINGDLSCKYKLTMNTGPFEFHGHVKIDSLGGTTPKTITTTTFNKNTSIDSTSYFAGPVNFASGLITFNSNCGFNGKVSSGNAGVFNFLCDTSFWNAGYISGDGNQVNLNGGRAVACTSSNLYKTNNSGAHTGVNVFSNNTPSSLVYNKFTRSRLGFSENPDPEITLNTSMIDTIYKTISTQQWGENKLTAEELNTMYEEAASKDSLWEGFLVIKYTYSGGSGAYSPFQTGTGKFNKKLIILNEDKNVRLSNFFETDTTSGIVVLYIKDYTDNSDILNTINRFRGFIYVEKVTANYLVITPQNHLKINGAVYFAPDAKSKFDGGGTKTTEITYDGNVLDSIAVTEIFTSTTVEVTAPKDSIILSGDILTNHLSLQH